MPGLRVSSCLLVLGQSAMVDLLVPPFCLSSRHSPCVSLAPAHPLDPLIMEDLGLDPQPSFCFQLYSLLKAPSPGLSKTQHLDQGLQDPTYSSYFHSQSLLLSLPSLSPRSSGLLAVSGKSQAGSRLQPLPLAGALPSLSLFFQSSFRC